MNFLPYYLFVQTFISLVGVITCPILAAYKNRNLVGWLISGLFFNIIAIIIVACLPRIECEE